jgi:RNA polymerase sigma factor (sigma-70 family)
MARPLPSILAQIIGKFATAIRLDASAGPELLVQFAETRDPAAFHDLVSIYAPMVWTVCSRGLRDPNDVEDAFQATFIALARKARRIARPERVSAWLHGVAVRASQRVRQIKARRRETGETALSKLTVGAEPSPELWAVLDEELLRLPEDLRQSFVLCRIEGRSHSEAAPVLGCAARTVGDRVARATELLKSRLRRRGLAPAGALAGLMPSTGVVPAAVVERTAAGALAGPSATAAAVADSVVCGMAGSGLWRYLAVAVLLIVSVGGGIALCRAPVRPTSETPARHEAPAPPSNPAAVLVWGRVLDAAGKPVPKAHVALMSRPPVSVSDPLPGDELVDKGEADNEGRYRLEGVPLSRREVKLAAWAEGHAVAAVVVPMPGSTRIVERDVHLSVPREIQGRLSERIPARRWQIEVVQIGPLRRPLGLPSAGETVGERKGDPLFWTKEMAVEDGKTFVLGGLDVRAGIRLRVSGKGSQILELGTEESNPAKFGPALGEPDFHAVRLPLEGHGSEKPWTFQLSLSKQGWVGGAVLVRKADTREMLDHATVWVGPALEGAQRLELLGPFQSRVEGDGMLLPYGLRWPAILHVCPPADSSYLAVRAMIDYGQKNDRVRESVIGSVEVSLPRGVPVRGVVTVEGTGKPVAGVTAQYLPRGRLADTYRGVVIGRAGLVRADAEGRFRIVVPPGPGYLLIDGPEDFTSKTGHYRAHRIVKIDVPPNAEKYDVKAALHRAEDDKSTPKMP